MLGAVGIGFAVRAQIAGEPVPSMVEGTPATRGGAGLFGFSHLLEFLKLSHRLVHAVLDSPLVQQHPVEHPGIGPIPRGKPAQQQMVAGNVRLVPGLLVCSAIKRFDLVVRISVKLLQAQIFDGLVLHSLGALKPPRQIDQPLGDDTLHPADGIALIQHCLAMQVVLLLALVPYDGLIDEKPVLERILRGDVLALSRLWPGGFERIATIGGDLSL